MSCLGVRERASVLKSSLSGAGSARGLPSVLMLSGLVLTGLVLVGCADLPTGGPLPPPPPPPLAAAPGGIVITTPFHAEDFAWSTQPGTAHIRGLSEPGRSCAGNAVALTPDTTYSRERIIKLYGSGEYAVIPTPVVRAKTIANDSPAMRGYVRSTRCDSAGGFAFDDIPGGSFFVIAEVGDPQGPRVVMRRVTAVAGRVLQVPLTGTGPGPKRTRRRPQ
jgi:hypothetical protein